MSTPASTQGRAAGPSDETTLATADPRSVALRTAVEVWVAASTSGTTRWREELIANKRKVFESFFARDRRDPGEVSPLDVQELCRRLRKQDGRP